MYMSVCKSAESQGVAVLHGSRGSFHAEKQPAFRAIYRAVEEVTSFYLFLLFIINHCVTEFCDSFIMNTNTVAPIQGDSVNNLASFEFLSRSTVRIDKGVYIYFCVSFLFKEMTHCCRHLSLSN
jgi:hypothetical protein